MKPIVSNVTQHGNVVTYGHSNVPRDVLLQFVRLFNFPSELLLKLELIIRQRSQAMIVLARGRDFFRGFVEINGNVEDLPECLLSTPPHWLENIKISIDGIIHSDVIVECTNRSLYEKSLSEAGLAELWTRPALPKFNAPDDHFTERQLVLTLPDMAGRLPKIIETLRMGEFVSLELPSSNMCLMVTRNGDSSSTVHLTHTGAPPIARQMRHYGIRFVFISMIDDEFFRIEGLPLAICRYLKKMAMLNQE